MDQNLGMLFLRASDSNQRSSSDSIEGISNGSMIITLAEKNRGDF